MYMYIHEVNEVLELEFFFKKILIKLSSYYLLA